MPGDFLSFTPSAIHVAGDTNAGLLLARVEFWEQRAGKQSHNWVYDTRRRWAMDAFGIDSEKVFDRARRLLVQAGLIEHKAQGKPKNPWQRCVHLRLTDLGREKLLSARSLKLNDAGALVAQKSSAKGSQSYAAVGHGGQPLETTGHPPVAHNPSYPPGYDGHYSSGDDQEQENHPVELPIKLQEGAAPPPEGKKEEKKADKKANWYNQTTFDLENIWVNAHAANYPDKFIQPWQGKQHAQAKSLMTSIKWEELVPSLQLAIKNWDSFTTEAEANAGGFDMPLEPTLSCVLLYAESMVNNYRKTIKEGDSKWAFEDWGKDKNAE